MNKKEELIEALKAGYMKGDERMKKKLHDMVKEIHNAEDHKVDLLYDVMLFLRA
jgi:hypothetical protein